MYIYLRKFITIPLLPLHLVGPSFNVLADKVYYQQHIPSKFWKNITKFLVYYRKQWLQSGEFVVSWNHNKMDMRTNNSLERRNRTLHNVVGEHAFLYDWVQKLATYYTDNYLSYEQYKVHGRSPLRTTNDKKRNKLLKEWWDYIDCKPNQTKSGILTFLEGTSKALKATA